MERSEIFDLVTSYVDNELKNENQIKNIKSIIDADEDIRYEYQLQSFLKTFVKNKVHSAEAPQTLRDRIISDIFTELKPVKEQKAESRKVNFFDSFIDYFKRPAFAFGFSIILIAALVMVFFSDNNLDDMAAGQIGESNMFVEAGNNFQQILNGNLDLQYQSSDPAAIKEFFKEQGVNYNTVIPKLNNSKIIGAVVSNKNGEKFAHHVYRTNSGKLVYLYQADEQCIKKKKTLNLSDDLVKYIDEGKLYKSEKDGHSFLVWKNQGNVCVVVSNESMDQLENKLISTKTYK